MSTTQKRITRSGFVQFKENKGAWQFYVSSFSSAHDVAHVLHETDGTRAVPIDKQDRLLIDGKQYGHKHWNH